MEKNKITRAKVIKSIFSLILIIGLFSSTVYAYDVLEEARYLIKNFYIENVSNETLNKTTVKEMVESLNDPYSVYFSNNEYKNFVNSVDMKFSGIGVRFEVISEGVRVVSVLKGSGAEDAGLKEGDIIIEADGKSLVGLSEDKIPLYLRGDEGTTVKVKVKRGSATLDFTITRKLIQTPTVEGEIINNHTAYIKISSFGEDTADKFGSILDDLNKKSPSNYIIDLRDNPGGFLDAALNIAGYFIGNNTVVKVRDRDGDEAEYKGYTHRTKIDKPVIFLTNENSASASEVLTGAIKDYGAAYIIGNRTFGKGLVQTMFSLSDGSYIKLTVLKFFSPKGNEINKVGITPDFNAEYNNSMLVAELLSGDSKDACNKTGFLKVKIDGRYFEIDLKLARQEKYYKAYNLILEKARESGNEIKIGTSLGWTDIPSEYKNKAYFMYYPEYKELQELLNVPVDKKFTVTFSSNVDKSTVEKSIELWDSKTGERIPLSFEFVDSKTVKAIPKNNLKNSGEYYFVVNPTVKGENGAYLKEGTVSYVKVIGN
ncbi:PDZ domain-containing protein [Caloramator sp. E03]|uniref:S41 family peptidase n=1 Tax=Caloramator sp. E03 TaxID=2576307 RepID=UPI0011105CCA|nr:S41 family peptidase [Caloramator sp. E03]QCX33441.1 PDZ domain-containing protein [Caloramator sp. E03]